MRALIVDDEPLARRGLTLRLRKLADVEVVGESADGASAIRAIIDLGPDVVFLDVQMPGMSGFDVLAALPAACQPAVVFLTAHEQHALQAFDVRATDYLLKPVNEERLAEAVDRVRERIALGTNGAPASFAVRSGSRIQIVPVADVHWIAAAGDYAELHTIARSCLVRETMTALDARLRRHGFLRIHRSRLVRLSSIRELRTLDNREYLVTLVDGSTHRSSRTYAPHLERTVIEPK